MRRLHATNWGSGHAVEVIKPVETTTDSTRCTVDAACERSRRYAPVRGPGCGAASRSDAPAASSVPVNVRPARAILQTRDPLGLVAPPPHIGASREMPMDSAAVRQATHLRCADRAADDLRESMERYGAREASERACCLVAPHSPGGFIHPRTPSARSMGTTASGGGRGSTEFGGSSTLRGSPRLPRACSPAVVALPCRR